MMFSALRLSVYASILALPFAVGADCMGPYPPSMVKAFNQSCAKDAQTVPFCTCIIDEVQKSIPLADFIEIGNTGTISSDPRFIKASTQCSAQLQTNRPADKGSLSGTVTPAAPATSVQTGTHWGPGR